jgi:mono/diheme cytochrome c family protein
MKAKCIVRSSLLLCLLPLFVACGKSESKTDPGTASKGDSAKLSSGFATNCASCHGSTGAGATGRSLQGYTGALSTFSSAVRGGKGSMPAFPASSYTDTDLNADYTYLKSL